MIEGHLKEVFFKYNRTHTHTCLLSQLKQVIKEYSTGQLGTLTNSDWKEASVTFSDYGTGVRIVSFTSQGKIAH